MINSFDKIIEIVDLQELEMFKQETRKKTKILILKLSFYLLIAESILIYVTVKLLFGLIVSDIIVFIAYIVYLVKETNKFRSEYQTIVSDSVSKAISPNISYSDDETRFLRLFKKLVTTYHFDLKTNGYFYGNINEIEFVFGDIKIGDIDERNGTRTIFDGTFYFALVDNDFPYLTVINRNIDYNLTSVNKRSQRINLRMPNPKKVKILSDKANFKIYEVFTQDADFAEKLIDYKFTSNFYNLFKNKSAYFGIRENYVFFGLDRRKYPEVYANSPVNVSVKKCYDFFTNQFRQLEDVISFMTEQGEKIKNI